MQKMNIVFYKKKRANIVQPFVNNNSRDTFYSELILDRKKKIHLKNILLIGSKIMGMCGLYQIKIML